MPDLTTGDLATGGGLLPTAVGLPKDGLIVIDPFLGLIMDGSKSLIVKSKRFKIGGKKFLLVTRKKAMGVIKLSAPTDIGLKEFKKLEGQHHVTEAMRKKHWAGKKSFVVYKIVSLALFAAPIPIEPVKGAHLVAKDVKFTEDVSIKMFELAKQDADAITSFGAWLRVLHVRAKSWAETTLQFVEGPKGTVEFIRGFPGVVGGLASSVPTARGVADAKAALPVALREATSWGLKAEKALRDAKETELADKIKDALKEIKRVTELLPRLADVEDSPVVKAE